MQPRRAPAPPLAPTGITGRFDRPLWLKDYAYLRVQLERSYAHLAWFASPRSSVDLRALNRRTLRALEDAEDDEDAKDAILAFVSKFHDGQLSPVAVLQPAASASLRLPNPAWNNLSPMDGCAALGFAPVRGIAFSLPFESLNGSTLACDGLSRLFRAGTVLSSHGTRFGIVRIQRFREKDGPPGICMQEWTAQKESGRPFDVELLQEKITETWFRTLAAQLRQFQTEGVAAVIVDVGGNSGGNDSGDWAARLFTAGEVHSAHLWMIAAPSAGVYFDEQLQGLRGALGRHPEAGPEARATIQAAIQAFERRKAGVSGRDCDMSWVWRERRNWNPEGSSRLVEAGFFSGQTDYLPAGALGDRDLASAVYWAATVDPWRGAWSGPVYVLTDGATASSAEMFSAIMRDNNVAKLVGTPTAGDGAGFMVEEPSVELPYSHLRFQIPDCVRLRADGTDEVAGIQPDLPVLPRQGEDPRARAARVLETLEADLLKATAPIQGEPK